VSHPRQPFDERNFRPAGLVDRGGRPWPLDRPWSYDPSARRAAEARRRRDQRHLPFLAEPLPDRSPDSFDLAELIDAVSDPVRSFVHRRLQLQLAAAADGTPTQLPVDIAGLERWKVGDRLVSAVRLGLDPEAWLDTERRRGSLPPGALGDHEADDLLTAVTVLDEAVRRLDVGEERGAVSIDVRLPDGTRIVGSVADAGTGSARGPARLGFGSLKPSYRLAGWIDLLALVATDPAGDWRSVVVNYDKKKRRAQVVHLTPRGADAATRQADALAGLTAAVEVARRARCEPLPMFPNLTHAVHEAHADGRRARSTDWRNRMGWADGDKVHAALAFGDHELGDLYEIGSRPDDPFDEPSRLVGWARYLWERVEASVVDLEAAPASDVDVDAEAGAEAGATAGSGR